MKRITCLLLSLLLLSGCVPARKTARSYLRADFGAAHRHGNTHFGDMVLSYPDPDAVLSAINEALAAVAASDDKQGLVAVYETQRDAYARLVSAASLAYVYHAEDVTDEDRAAEYVRLSNALYAIEQGLVRLEKALMDRWGYHGDRGEDYAATLERMSRSDGDRLRTLHEREEELCRSYERLEAEYGVDYGDRTWTFAELMTDNDLSFPSFLEALDLYEQGRNRVAGELYLELMSVRKEMARESGEEYVQSRYAAYGRTYAPEEALAAARTVKEVFVPLYVRLREQCENDLRYLVGAAFPEEPFLTAMEAAAERAVPGAGEAWRYMLTYGLYNSQPSEKKMQASFTTYLAAYRCPFLFTQWTDDASSAFTLIHEFGHFISYYTNPEGTYYGSEDLDLAETDAQGFELLMLEEYDALFGRYAPAARICFLTNALYAIISGFMEDEFQQRAFALEDPTVEDLNGLYGQLAHEYGFDVLFGYEGREWTDIGHTFQFPFYYVSYGVSMLGAMTLREGGSRAYERVIHRSAGTTFSEAVGKNVLDEETIREVAARVESLADGWLQAG